MKSALALGALLILLALTPFTGTSAPKPDPDPSAPFRVQNKFAGNGIAVEEPKVFDNRSLVLMIEKLDESLARLSVVDQAPLLKNIGVLQGFQKSEVSRAFSISTLPVPGVETIEKKDTNSGVLVPDSRTTKSSEFTPTKPTLDAVNFPSVADDKMGIASQDILAEQVNLTYQIVNLRMLLEQSVSDRYIKKGDKPGPRAQAVLGFHVSLDPMKQHKGKAAIVEIELTSPSKKRPSLVSVMPQAKTYNVAAISQKSTSFSGSAVVKVVSLGYSQRNSRQTYFIHQDADTIAFERPRAILEKNKREPEKLVFGWEFRPVLNLESVQGGGRQLFAVVALDEFSDANPNLNVLVRTYWVGYDKEKAVVSSAPREITEFTLSNFAIPSSLDIQKGLGPQVRHIEFKTLSDDSALIDVWGENFYNGTSAVLGNRVLTRNDSALIIKSDQLLQIAARPYDLVSGQPFLAGRYGSSIPLLDNQTLEDAKKKPDIFKVFAEFRRGDVSPIPKLDVILQTESGCLPDLKGQTVVVLVGTSTYVRQAGRWSVGPDENDLRTIIYPPDGAIEKNPVVFAAIPFFGAEYQTSAQIYSPQSIEKAIILKSNATEQIWGIVGKGFDTSVTKSAATAVMADQEYKVSNGLKFPSETLATFTIDSKKAAEVKTLVVTLGYNPAFMIAAPKLTPSPAKVVINSGQSLVVTAGSAPLVDFVGENLSEVSKISFDGTALPFSVADDAKKVSVFLNRKVTEKAGKASLVIEGKDGSLKAAEVTVQ